MLGRCFARPSCARAIHTASAPVTDVSLNWALAKSGVVPPAQAFRNLTASQLSTHGASAAETKPLVVQVGASGPVANAYAVVMKKVVDHLNGSSKVFVQDGAIGASGKECVTVRAISDHAAAAAQAQAMLHVQPLRAPSAFKPALTVFSAGELQLPEAVKADLGAASHSGAVIMINSSKQRVVVVGHSTSAAIQQALGTAGVSVLGAPVAAFVAAPAASNSALVVGPAVAGAALTLWGPQGFSAAFASGSSSAALAAANVWRAPVNVFLCTRDSTGALPAVAKLTSAAQQKLHFALSGATSAADATAQADRFAAVAAKSNVFLVNTALVADVNALANKVGSQAISGAADANFGFVVPSAGSLGLDGSAQSSNNDAAKKLVADLTAKAKKEQPKLALDGAFAAAL